MDYAPAKTRDKMYDSILVALQGSEEKMLRHLTPGHDPTVTLGLKIPVTLGDVAFLTEEIFRGRSAISGIPTRLHLIRWQRPTGSTLNTMGEGENLQKWSNLKLSDLACMTKEEAARHEKEYLKGDKTLEDLYSKETIDKIEGLRQETAKYEKFR